MKKLTTIGFPVMFALLTLALFLLIFRPGWATAGMTSACLVLLTALAWSAQIVFGGRELRGSRVAYPVFSLLASLALVFVLRPFPVEAFCHGLMVGVQALGTLGIALYLRILKQKGENLHD